jgi:hypothetical protein
LICEDASDRPSHVEIKDWPVLSCHALIQRAKPWNKGTFQVPRPRPFPGIDYDPDESPNIVTMRGGGLPSSACDDDDDDEHNEEEGEEEESDS